MEGHESDVEVIHYYKDMTWSMVCVLITFLIICIKIPDKKWFKGEKVYSTLQFEEIYAIMLGSHGGRNGRAAGYTALEIR